MRRTIFTSMIEQESPPSSPHEASTHSGPNVLTQWFFLLIQANFRIADRVMNFIFAFMKIFLVIGRAYAPCASVAVDLPASFYMDKKSYTGFQNVKFQKMPVCKQCGVYCLILRLLLNVLCGKHAKLVSA